MKAKSALAKAMLLECLSGSIQMKCKDDCLKKTNKFPKSFIWVCMSFKEPEEMTFITSSINEYVYIEILDNFLIPLLKN